MELAVWATVTLYLGNLSIFINIILYITWTFLKSNCGLYKIILNYFMMGLC